MVSDHLSIFEFSTQEARDRRMGILPFKQNGKTGHNRFTLIKIRQTENNEQGLFDVSLSCHSTWQEFFFLFFFLNNSNYFSITKATFPGAFLVQKFGPSINLN